MSDDVKKVQAQIAETRAALAETTAALVAKADVKDRAKAKIQQEKTPLIVAAGVVALVTGLLLWRRHR